jgi:hypothetical protein
MEILKESGAIVKFECDKMSLTDIGKAPERMAQRSINAPHSHFLEGKEGHNLQPTRRDFQCTEKQVTADPHAREFLARLDRGYLEPGRATPWHLGANMW